MRVVVLAPSIWSEVSVAVVVKLARAGFTPAGAIALPTMHGPTLLRKAMQWGPRDLMRYGARRMLGRGSAPAVRNAYLADAGSDRGVPLRNLAEAARHFAFPLLITRDMNAEPCVETLARWGADAMIYSGGGILRSRLLGATEHGVLNMHIGLLPEVRGMSCPEWSLLLDVPVGVTIHRIDTGIDTGPVLLRRTLPRVEESSTIRDLRDRLTAYGTDLVVEAIAGLARGTLSPRAQDRRDEDLQYFVIHERLSAIAQARLRSLAPASAGASAPSPAPVV